MIKIIFSLTYGVLLYSWFFQINSIYYRFALANQIGLGVTLLIAILIGWSKKTSSKKEIAMAIGLAILPFTLQPLVSTALVEFNKSWIIINVLIAIAGFLLSKMNSIKFMALPLLSIALVWFVPFEIHESQKRFTDKVIESTLTDRGNAEIVQWKDGYWLHYHDELQFSTLDKHILAEAFALPAAHLYEGQKKVLIIGGENHLLMSELSKLTNIDKLDVFPFDMSYFEFVDSHRKLLGLQEYDAPLHVDLFDSAVLFGQSLKYDLVYLDFSETENANTFELSHLRKIMDENGFLVIPAGNPYLESESYRALSDRLTSHGFNLILYHTQIPSLGEMSWIIASQTIDPQELKQRLLNIKPATETLWWSAEAMKMMLSFGKKEYFDK